MPHAACRMLRATCCVPHAACRMMLVPCFVSSCHDAQSMPGWERTKGSGKESVEYFEGRRSRANEIAIEEERDRSGVHVLHNSYFGDTQILPPRREVLPMCCCVGPGHRPHRMHGRRSHDICAVCAHELVEPRGLSDLECDSVAVLRLCARLCSWNSSSPIKYADVWAKALSKLLASARNKPWACMSHGH
jgi:hypothetical protein